MKFYKLKYDEYLLRKDAFNNILWFDELVLWYLENEAHTLLTAGYLSKFIKENKLNNLKTLEVGIDFMKEFTLNKLNNLQFTVFDIDPHFVNVAQKLNDLLGFPNLYLNDDITKGNVHKYNLKSIQLALLIQMDYQFSDEQLKNIFLFFHKTGIQNVVVLSPSIYKLKLNPTSIHQYVSNKLNSIRSLKYRGQKGEIHYRRSLPHFKRILSKIYKLANHNEFQYPSGNIHIAYFKSI